jgi:predicted nucleotidyltransferase
MSIADSFITLISRIQPLARQEEVARRHTDTIKKRLRDVFKISDFEVTGSSARGTSIRGFSDTDLFAVFRRVNFIHGGRLIDSNRALSNIREELVSRYPFTPIYKDSMSITASFATGENVDIVPALFKHLHQGRWPVFEIPDGVGGWMLTAPKLYEAFINEENKKSGYKLRYVAQIMKFWRECREPRIPISSFHIEMVLALEKICKVQTSYSVCIRDILRSLAARNCAGLQDPFNIGGLIPAVKTGSQRSAALNAVITWRDRAHNAIIAEEGRNTPEARRIWKLVFNQKFPS